MFNTKAMPHLTKNLSMLQCQCLRWTSFVKLDMNGFSVFFIKLLEQLFIRNLVCMIIL